MMRPVVINPQKIAEETCIEFGHTIDIDQPYGPVPDGWYTCSRCGLSAFLTGIVVGVPED